MKKILIAALKFYRGWISPAMPGSCRFAPSCSAYALVAIERHGAFRGTALTARRILRCHPFNPGGYDPVPGRVLRNGETEKRRNGDSNGSLTLIDT